MHLLKISNLLEQVLERPEKYVGSCAVTNIMIFLEGYKYAILIDGGNPHDELYDGFQPWVAKRFKIESMHDWASIIAFMAQSETRAFEMTKDLWSQYKSEYEEKKSLSTKTGTS